MSVEILTLPEVASMLRVANKTDCTMAQKGEIPAFKVRHFFRPQRPRTLDDVAADIVASEKEAAGVLEVLVKSRSALNRDATARLCLGVASTLVWRNGAGARRAPRWQQLPPTETGGLEQAPAQVALPDGNGPAEELRLTEHLRRR